jgi:molybdopterin molybdotransferase
MSSALLSYDEALALLSEQIARLGIQPPAVEQIDLAASAYRVLAEPVVADRDQPPFPRSTRDGFACRAAEAVTHDFLPVAGSIRAGDPPAGPLPRGAVWEIMTGAAVPEGADAVAMLEHVETAGGKVRLSDGRTIDAGENIVPRGGEAKEGDELVPAGVRLAAAHIAVAASCGYATLPVHGRPRVAILTTGDELVAIDAEPKPGQIRNSNAPMLAALVAEAGGKPMILPRAADNAEALDVSLEMAASAEMLLISGGVSAGKFDLVEEALARAGAAFHFTGVRIQPGKPAVFGDIPRNRPEGVRRQPFLGLPGNPISSAVTFLLFAAPVLAGLSGAAEPSPRFVLARLSQKCKGKPGLTRFVPARCVFQPVPGELPSVTAVGWQGSGDLAAFARSNCFIRVPDNVDSLQAGEAVHILLV